MTSVVKRALLVTKLPKMQVGALTTKNTWGMHKCSIRLHLLRVPSVVQPVILWCIFSPCVSKEISITFTLEITEPCSSWLEKTFVNTGLTSRLHPCLATPILDDLFRIHFQVSHTFCSLHLMNARVFLFALSTFYRLNSFWLWSRRS